MSKKLYTYYKFIGCERKESQKMKETEMLKKNYEFRNVLTKGHFFIGRQLKVVILKNRKKCKLLGIAISSKNGKAYQRNRAKRLIRESYKILEEKIENGYTIVILIKNDINLKDLKFIDILNELKDTLKKSQILYIKD